MGAFGDSYWEEHPMVYHNDRGESCTQVSGVEVTLKEYFGKDKDYTPPVKALQWTAYKNTAKGAIFLGGNPDTNYKPVSDKKQALTFATKELVQDYIKDFNEELKKQGESIWMPIEVK